MKSRKHVDEHKTIRYYNDQGYFHRLSGPVIIDRWGNKVCWVNDNFHRLYGPSDNYSEGDNYWYVNTKNLYYFKVIL